MSVRSEASVERVSTRIDPDSGAREEAAFFGLDSERLFGVTHIPSGDIRGGVLICSPLHAEFLRHYRNEVLTARALAGRGFAVHRFHYRGAGQSDGDDFFEPTLDTMVEDTIAAGERLRERLVGRPISVLGTRWGGLIAGSAAAELNAVALALWEPVTDPAAYFQEGFRALLLRRLKGKKADGDSPPAPLEDLRRDGSVDVLGYALDQSLYDGAVQRQLASEVRSQLPVFVLQLSRGHTLRAPLEKLKSQLESRGCQVTTHLIREQVAWFFQDTDSAQSSWLGEAHDVTGGWLTTVHAARSAA